MEMGGHHARLKERCNDGACNWRLDLTQLREDDVLAHSSFSEKADYRGNFT